MEIPNNLEKNQKYSKLFGKKVEIPINLEKNEKNSKKIGKKMKNASTKRIFNVTLSNMKIWLAKRHK